LAAAPAVNPALAANAISVSLVSTSTFARPRPMSHWTCLRPLGRRAAPPRPRHQCRAPAPHRQQATSRSEVGRLFEYTPQQMDRLHWCERQTSRLLKSQSMGRMPARFLMVG
jgi:hypothetical protein